MGFRSTINVVFNNRCMQINQFQLKTLKSVNFRDKNFTFLPISTVTYIGVDFSFFSECKILSPFPSFSFLSSPSLPSAILPFFSLSVLPFSPSRLLFLSSFPFPFLCREAAPSSRLRDLAKHFSSPAGFGTEPRSPVHCG